MKKNKLNCILEEVRKKGRNGDTILAHINPIEAIMLKKAGGSGTINPKTGLPEFLPRFLSHPFKTIEKAFKNPGKTASRFIGNTVAPIGGAILGNMILPGVGGIIGGGLGGGVGSASIGKKFGSGAIMGALQGALLPTAASAAGWGANAVGAKGLGTTLTNYGNTNAILPSLGLGEKTASTLKGAAGSNALLSTLNPSKTSGVNAGDDYEDYLNYKTNESRKDKNEEELTFLDKLGRNTSNFLTKPKNLLAVGSLGLSLYDRMNQPKPLTPAQKGRMAKEEMLAMRLTPAEIAAQEEYELMLEQSKRRNARKKFLPEERIDITPLYNRVSSPEEYAQTGRWINYYDNPRFSGQPVRF